MFRLGGIETTSLARPMHQLMEIDRAHHIYVPDSFFIVEMYIFRGAHDPEEGWDLYGGKPC